MIIYQQRNENQIMEIKWISEISLEQRREIEIYLLFKGDL